jgi:hypothetical protein
VADAYVPSDREPLPSGLLPAERCALTLVRKRLDNSVDPPPFLVAVLVATIDRLTGGRVPSGDPELHAFTRDGLIEALARLELHPVAGKVSAESMADALIEALGDLSGERRATDG